MRASIAKSFGYVAICALITVALFIVVLDVLKYGFGIDPAREDQARAHRKKAKFHSAIRFLYVPSPETQNQSM